MLNNKIVFLSLSVIVLIILLFVSTDSYFHGLYGKIDSSIFYMCGKAWMNGYVPYTEISDSKGPLLWLIYGFGYLLSHTDYTGVFWVSWLFYTFTFFYVYKMVRLFVTDAYLAYVTTIGMGLAFFNICVHNIIRSEDFCQLFIVISLYETCELLYSNNINGETWKKASFIVGVCLACTFMIKFTITAMLMFFVVCIFFLSKKKDRTGVVIKWIVLGAGLIILPFSLYFICIGCMRDFIYEYFIRTFSTVNNSQGNGMKSLLYPNVAFFNIVMLFSVCLFAFYKRKMGSKCMFPLISFLWFLLITAQNAWNYYFNSLSSFFVFGLIAYSCWIEKKVYWKKRWILAIPILMMMIIILPIKFVPTVRDSFLLNNQIEAEAFTTFSNYIKTKTKPKILYIGGIPSGVGVVAEALPACRFFFCQTGQTEDMGNEQKKAVMNHIADYIIVSKNDLDIIPFLQKNGYRLVMGIEYRGTCLYAL